MFGLKNRVIALQDRVIQLQDERQKLTAEKNYAEIQMYKTLAARHGDHKGIRRLRRRYEKLLREVGLGKFSDESLSPESLKAVEGYKKDHPGKMRKDYKRKESA